jgi:hypothetical protein
VRHGTIACLELGLTLGAGRVEFLPVEWHSVLHADVDERTRAITLESVAFLRNFMNDNVLDAAY